MNIETALKTAIEYEIRVRELYVEAQADTNNANAKKLYSLMAEEEHGHVEYLNHKLDIWQKSSTLDSSDLGTALPPVDEITKHMEELTDKIKANDFDSEIKVLERALALETETSNFYQKLVDELEPEGQAFFRRFIEIESGHLEIVNAEIASLTGSGYWFGMPEFDLEKG